MIALLAVVIAVIGLLMYAWAGNPKLQEVGRIMFFCGLLAFLLEASVAVHALPGVH